MALARSHLRSVPRRDDDTTLAVGDRLTVGEARAFCTALQAALGRGMQTVTVDARDVGATDAAGLAALLQAHRVAGAASARMTVLAGPRLERDMVDARVVEELDVVAAGARPALPGARVERPAGRPLVASAGRVTLRQPDLADVQTFRAWGGDGLLDQMLGSHLLYRCGHAPGDDAALLGAIAHDPRALTAVIEAASGDGPPLGFVRLYEIDLVAGFAFLETAVVEPRALRRGIGIEASRLLIAYGMDALAMRRVEAKVFAYNVLSINALRRNGFRQEGVLREARIYEHQAWDILVFSILDREMRRERARERYPSFALFGSDAGPAARERPA